jgi:hypothetical protein
MTVPHVAVQTAAAVLALFISIFAAVFSWQQVEVSRVHNRISVAPILHVTPYAEGKSGRNGLYVSNVGLGPALIKEFRASSGAFVAEGFESDRWIDILAAAKINPACFATGWPRLDSVVKAGEELPLVHVTKADGADICYTEMIKLIGGTGVEVAVTYESVYGEQKRMSETSKVNSRSVNLLYQQLFAK